MIHLPILKIKKKYVIDQIQFIHGHSIKKKSKVRSTHIEL